MNSSQLLRQCEGDEESILQQLEYEERLDVQLELWELDIQTGLEGGVFIDTSTGKIRFRAQTEEDSQTICAICIDSTHYSNPRYCKYDHWFCFRCILKLVREVNIKCPMCHQIMFENLSIN